MPQTFESGTPPAGRTASRRFEALVITAFSMMALGLGIGVQSLLVAGSFNRSLLYIFISIQLIVLVILLGIAFFTQALLERYHTWKPTAPSSRGNEPTIRPFDPPVAKVQQTVSETHLAVGPAFPAKEFLEVMQELERQTHVDPKDVLALAQSVVIAGLLAWLSLEYQANLNMQVWLTQNFFPGTILLDGRFISGLIGSVMAATIFFILRAMSRRRSLRELQERFR